MLLSGGVCLLQVNNFTINFGPQHPAAHGVLRLVLEMKGEHQQQLQLLLSNVQLARPCSNV